MIDRDGNPLSSSSARIGSYASWRMNASIFFMRPALLGLGRGHRGDSRRGGCPDRRRRAAGEQSRRVLGLRDELLLIAIHPVLGDVEPGVLLLGADAYPDRLLEQEEDPEGDGEHAPEGD